MTPIEQPSRRLITHLRHVDLAVPDHDAQVDFYTGQWGLVKVGSDAGVTYLAPEGSPEQYQVRVRASEDKRLDLIAFGASTPADVDELAARLGREGVRLVSEPGTLQTMGGGYGFRFFDVDGRTVEVSADVAVREHRRIEEGESIPVKLSHVVLNSPSPEATVAFYDRHLAFRLSDTIMHPRMGNMMWFLRCNPQHHSVAVARGPHTSLHHLSFELRGLDEYMRGTGRLLRPQRLVGPRPPATRDEGEPRPGEGQGLRDHPGPVDRDRRRVRRPARRRRIPEAADDGERQRRRDRPRPAVEHGVAVRRTRRLRLQRHLGAPRRVLGSGTCGNGGCLAELWGRRGRQDPPPLRPGDVAEMTVEGIGTISNTVLAGLPAPFMAPARVRPRDRA